MLRWSRKVALPFLEKICVEKEGEEKGGGDRVVVALRIA
jgi:hypothetical protein